MKWIERVNLPSEVGIYLARTGQYTWWNVIVSVHGDSPFFNVDVWFPMDDKLAINASVYDIEEFGPKISNWPPPNIDRTNEEWKKIRA